MNGAAGNDSLTGLGGNDWFNGGAGNDLLEANDDRFLGANDSDHFVFDQTPGAANADSIVDFQTGFDKLHLDGRVMTAVGPSGNFAAGDARFYSAAGATGGHDSDDRVVFDTSTGNLYYDADGNGASAAGHFRQARLRHLRFPVLHPRPDHHRLPPH